MAFSDFVEYDIALYLQNTGLYELFSTKSKQGFYPTLRHLFFTNLVYEDNGNEILSTIVKGTEIELTPRSLGKILHISYQDLTINDIHIDDEKVLSRIYLSGQGSLMADNKLQPIHRLITCIFVYNIRPKTRSYNYFSRELATCVYAIYG